MGEQDGDGEDCSSLAVPIPRLALGGGSGGGGEGGGGVVGGGMVERGVRAVLVVTNKTERGVFRPADQDMLAQFARDVAGSVAAALERSLLSETHADHACGLGTQIEGLEARVIALKQQAVGQAQLTRRARALFSIFRNLSSTHRLESIFDEVMREAHHLLNADRSTLFLLDKDTGELWSKVAEGVDGVIRFPQDRGLAGHAACAGQMVNVARAYDDERFSREVDQRTGYKTTSVLCSPICAVDGSVLGVVQVSCDVGQPTHNTDRAWGCSLF